MTKNSPPGIALDERHLQKIAHLRARLHQRGTAARPGRQGMIPYPVTTEAAPSFNPAVRQEQSITEHA